MSNEELKDRLNLILSDYIDKSVNCIDPEALKEYELDIEALGQVIDSL